MTQHIKRFTGKTPKQIR
ncbi:MULTISPECIES: hypothetical protein [Cyanophyceae]|nr:hypothetical protein [Fortiea sp. LEGE XX443]